jgi:hypothetical protein
MKGNMERHVTKRCNVFESLISTFIFVKESFKKDDVPKKEFLECLGFNCE